MVQAQAGGTAQIDVPAVRNYYRVYRAEGGITSRGPQFAYFTSPSSNAVMRYIQETLNHTSYRSIAPDIGYDVNNIVKVDEVEARQVPEFDTKMRAWESLDVFCLGTVPIVWVQTPPATSVRR